MKKITLFACLFLLMGISSCSSDDHATKNEKSVIGKWQYESTTFNGSLYTPDDCEAQSTIEFFSNGKLTYIDYYIDSEENCVFEAEQETWKYLADDIYSFTVEDGDSYSVPITISEDNSSFTVMDKDEDGEYETVYVRI